MASGRFGGESGLRGRVAAVQRRGLARQDTPSGGRQRGGGVGPTLAPNMGGRGGPGLEVDAADLAEVLGEDDVRL